MKVKKTILVVSSFLVLLITSSSMTSIRAAYGVEVGDTFTYVVKQASGEFNYKTGTITTSTTVNGYTLGDDAVPVNSELTINITAVDASSVAFNISSGEYSTVTSTSSLTMGFGLLIGVLFPFLVLSDEAEFDPTEGVSLGDWVYFAASDTDWDDFIEAWNTTSEDFLNETEGADLSLELGSVLENSDRDVRFWLYLTGSIKNATENIDLTVNHKVMFAYDTSSGVLLGYRMVDNLKGTFDGRTTTFKLNLEIVQKEYSLPAFAGGGTPGFEYIPALLMLTTWIVLLRRRKRK